jgi:hypothetical protein
MQSYTDTETKRWEIRTFTESKCDAITQLPSISSEISRNPPNNIDGIILPTQF